jgi:thiol-disulfide isomerase/thioredoxin
MDFAAQFPKGLSYAEFLQAYGTADQTRRWAALHTAVRLNASQQALLAGFTRDMQVLCLAGAWCGDCVNQCPIFDHFAAVSPRIQLRFFDRDANPELAAELRICGGARVPVVVFLSEDGQEVGRYGDRTLSKYRQMVSQMAGSSCPTGLVLPEQELLDAVTGDWLNEFERAQWILRTSGRLRQLHGD